MNGITESRFNGKHIDSTTISCIHIGNIIATKIIGIKSYLY